MNKQDVMNVMNTAKSVAPGKPFIVEGKTFGKNAQGDVFILGKGNEWTLFGNVKQAAVPAIPGTAGAKATAKKPQYKQGRTFLNLVASGYLGQDPEFTKLKDGRTCCNFSIGINDIYRGVEWMKVACYGKLAEAQNGKLTKGSLVVVTTDQPLVKYKTEKGHERIQIVARKIIWASLKSAQQNAYENQPEPENYDGYDGYDGTEEVVYDHAAEQYEEAGLQDLSGL